MMKKLMLLCAANLLAMLAFGADDVYYNNKTFSAAESTDGNVYIGPSTASEEALVTVKSGATWDSAANIFLGNAPGTSKLLIEEGGVLNATSSGVALSTISAVNGDAEIENRGTVNLYSLHMGTTAKGAADSIFHNYGTLNVAYNFHLGKKGGTTNVFHHHKGAILNVNATGTYRFYVGGEGGYSTMILDDSINVKSKLWMGTSQWSRGNIVLNDEAVMNFGVGDELILGYSNDTTAKVEMNDNSRIVGKAKVHIGGAGARSNGYVVMSNNTVIAVTNNSGFAVAAGNNSKGKLELNDNANLLIGTNLTVAGGASSYGHLVLRDNSCIDIDNDVIVVGGGGSSTGIVELCDFEGTFSEVPKLATNVNSLGILRLSGTTEYTLPANYKLGNLSGSTGMVDMKDDAILRLPSNYLIQGVKSATGVIRLSDRAKIIADSDRFQVGGDNDMSGRLELADNAMVAVTNLCVAYQWQNKSNIKGVVEISDNAVITNVTLLCLGRGATASGLINMCGGSIFFDSRYYVDNALTLGYYGKYSTGVIRGWGFLGFDDPRRKMIDYEEAFGAGKKWGSMRFIGQMIADGEGVERTLDFSRGPIPTAMINDGVVHNFCETNGFYAVNKGKLKFQRSLPRLTQDHKQVGIQPDYSNPIMVNGFQYTFDSATMNTLGTYVFSELYAVDRSDIPSGLPTGEGIHHAAVYRIGHFNSTATPDVDDENLADSHKQDFETLKLKFHYDPRIVESLSDKHMIRVYRCVDSVNGGWRRVGGAVPNASSPYVETRTFGASDELWNVGWFAIVAEPKKCTAIIVR